MYIHLYWLSKTHDIKHIRLVIGKKFTVSLIRSQCVYSWLYVSSFLLYRERSAGVVLSVWILELLLRGKRTFRKCWRRFWSTFPIGFDLLKRGKYCLLLLSDILDLRIPTGYLLLPDLVIIYLSLRWRELLGWISRGMRSFSDERFPIWLSGL